MSLQKLEDKNAFDRTVAQGLCLVDFNATWCAPCKAQEPILDQLAEQYQNRATLAAVDVDQNQAVAVNFGIQSIPTLVLFKDGQEMERFVGLQSEEVLSGAINRYLAS